MSVLKPGNRNWQIQPGNSRKETTKTSNEIAPLRREGSSGGSSGGNNVLGGGTTKRSGGKITGGTNGGY